MLLVSPTPTRSTFCYDRERHLLIIREVLEYRVPNTLAVRGLQDEGQGWMSY